MKKEVKQKPTKSERLGWASLKEGANIKFTEEMVKGRFVSEIEITSRLSQLDNDKNSLLVP